MPFKWLRLFCFGLLVIFLLPASGLAETAPDAVAKVGNLLISKYELKREMQRILPMNIGFHGKVSDEKAADIKEQAVQGLIEQSWKVQYAIAQEISVPITAVDERLVKVREKFKTDAELEKALGGESIAAFRASVYRMLLAKKAEQVTITEKAKPTAEEVQQQFENNKQMYKRPQQYRAQHILIKIDPTLVGAEREELVLKAEGLAKQAKAGEDFYNLAYYNSDEPTKFVGGDTGYFHSGQVVKEFEDAIKDLEPGEIVGPVETIAGFHVIKLTEIKEPQQMTFADVKLKISKGIEEKRREALYQTWLAELKKQYPVEMYDTEM